MADGVNAWMHKDADLLIRPEKSAVSEVHELGLPATNRRSYASSVGRSGVGFVSVTIHPIAIDERVLIGYFRH
jgi:hypothetical protein